VSQATGSPGEVSKRKQHALDLFAGLPRRYDLIGALFSFGQEPRWRTRLVHTLDGSGAKRILDVATGSGLIATAIVGRRGGTLVALDQSEPMLARARMRIEADERLRARITLVRGEAERLPFGACEFDAVTLTYLLRYVDDPAVTVAELARVVKPGGRIASLEFGVPGAPVARLLWSVYVAAGLPLLGALVSSDWYRVGRFLGPSIRGFWQRYPLERQIAFWRAAGIDSVEVVRLSFGAGVIISGVKRDVDPGAARVG
jgi:demethylmenaquinone methyltransferase / 2-methoxy-6-polyprenyl-1,4-benzoquinol methylase